METELRVISESGNYHIVLIPTCYDHYSRPLPKGVEQDDALCKPTWRKRWQALKRIPYLMLKMMTSNEQHPDSLKHWYQAFKYIYGAALSFADVCERAKNSQPCVFYCYWLIYVPIAFAMYKELHPATKHRFVSRAHGTDIYGSELGIFHPLRQYLMEGIDAVYAVSEYGKTYLQQQFPEASSKIYVSRLGTDIPKVSFSTAQSTTLQLISCAEMRKVKRVSLLYRTIYHYALQHANQAICWTHIGDGEEMSHLRNEVAQQPVLPNLTVVLKGCVQHDEVLQLYQHNHFDVFISVSQSEGVPVSLMEAMANGVPVVATHVGGVGEIVTEQTGCLIPVSYTHADFDAAMENVLSNRMLFAHKAYEKCAKEYNAKDNYTAFYAECLTNH